MRVQCGRCRQLRERGAAATHSEAAAVQRRAVLPTLRRYFLSLLSTWVGMSCCCALASQPRPKQRSERTLGGGDCEPAGTERHQVAESHVGAESHTHRPA